MTVTFDLESGVRVVTWATSVPILLSLGVSVLDLGPMYATDRRQTDRQTSDTHHHLMPPSYRAGHNNVKERYKL